MKDNKETDQIEVVEPKIVKSKRVKKVVKWTFSENVGIDDTGKIRYEKGQSYELTKKQIDNYLINKKLCQH